MTKLQERPQSVHSLDLESLLSAGHRAKDMLAGAKAMLVGVPAMGAGTAGNLVCEASAQLASIIAALETAAAQKAEADRAEHAHRQEQARVTASMVGRAP